MSDTTKFADTTGGKILVGVVITLVIGGITQGVALYSTSQVTNQRLSTMENTLQELKNELKAAREGASGSWTKADHVAYASGVNARINKTWDTINSIRDEQSKRTANVYRVESLTKAFASLEARLVAHEASPAHGVATVELQRIRERLRLLETKVK